MNQYKTFEEFLTTQTHQMPVGNFIFNLLITTLLAYLLSLIYRRFAFSCPTEKCLLPTLL